MELAPKLLVASSSSLASSSSFAFARSDCPVKREILSALACIDRSSTFPWAVKDSSLSSIPVKEETTAFISEPRFFNWALTALKLSRKDFSPSMPILAPMSVAISSHPLPERKKRLQIQTLTPTSIFQKILLVLLPPF